MGHKRRIRIALAAGVFVALAVVLLVALHLPFARQIVLDQAIQFAEEAGYELEASRLDYNVVTGRVSLEDIAVRAAGAADPTPLFRADLLEAELGVRDLFGRRLLIKEGRLVRPQLAAIYLADGGSNLPSTADDQATPEEPAGAPLEWSIRSFAVESGSLLFEDRDLPAAVTLPNWSLNLSGGDDGRTQLNFASNGEGALRWKDQEGQIGALAVEGSLTGNDVDLSDVEIDLPFIGASGTGSVSFGGDPAELSVEFALNAEAARLAEFFEVEQDIAGPVTLSVQGGGSLDELSLTAGIQSDAFRYQALDGIALDIEAGWTAGADILDVPRADLSAAFGVVNAQGQVAIDDGGSSSLTAQIERLQLARLTREFDSPVIVASTATGSAEVSWQGTDPERILDSLTGVADLRLAASRSTPAENTVPVAGVARLRAANGVKTFNLSSLAALGTSWTGSVQADAQDRLSGQITGMSTDVGASYAGLQSFLGEPLGEDALDVSGRLDARLDIAGTVESPRLNAALAGEGLSAGEIRDAAIETRATYANEEIAIETASVNWAEQNAMLTGRVNISGDEPTVSLNFAANSLDIGAVRSALANETPIDGVVDVEGSVEGTLDAPSGQVAITGTSLTAYGQPFGALNADFALSEGVARINTFRLDQSVEEDAQGVLTASGEYRLEDGVFSLVAEGRDISLERLQLSEQEQLGGTLNLDLAAEGTVEGPELQAEATLTGAGYGERELGELQLNLATQDGRAQIIAQAPKYSASLTADVGMEAPYAGTLELALDNTDLNQLELEGPKGAPVTGNITATLTAEGEIDNWQDATARLEMQQTAVQAIERLPIETNGNVVMRYENRTLFAEQVAISAGLSTFEIAGSLPLEQPSGSAALTVQGNLDLNQLASFVPSETPIGAAGRVELDATVGGSLTEPVPEGEIRLRDAAVFNEAIISPFTSMNGTVRLSGETVELESLTGDWAGAKLALSGSAPLALAGLGDEAAAPEPFRIEWSLNGLVVNSLTDLPRGTGGTISLGGHVEGTSAELATLEGAVEVSELDVYYDAIRVTQPQPSRLRLDNGTLTVESFELQGDNLQMSLTGDVKLQPDVVLNLDLSADTNAGVPALAVDNVSATGPIRVRLAARGPAAEPEVTGEVAWTEGEIASSQAGLAAQNIDMELALTPGVVSIQRFIGTLNGGSLEAGGNFTYEGVEIGEVDLTAKADGVFLEIPEDLRTVSNADLTIQSEGDNIVIGGSVQVEEGVYREPIAFDLLLVDLLRGTGGTTDFVSEPDPLLARTRFNLTVESINPIVVDNNIAKLGATLDLRLTGSYYRPGLLGRVQLEEGGELYISENRYFVDRGVIDFLNESRIQPSLDILARTQVRSKYDIELAITGGGVEPVETQLTSSSHQELGEPDLISLLLTGRLRENLRGEEVNVAAEQSLSYLTGRIGGRLSRAAQDTLGLSEVRIEPNLIAAESDPGARLTVGQNLNSYVSLVYSMNLADSSDQIWTVRYDVTRRFQARGVRQADDTYRFDFQHDVRFGGGQDVGRIQRTARVERVVGDVTVSGDHPLTEEQIQSKLKLKQGKPYDFFSISKGSDKIESMLEKDDYLEAKVSVGRELQETTVDLDVTVEAGPNVDLVYEGWSPSGSLKKDVRQVWSDGVFDAQRLDDARRVILTDITERGYLAAELRTEVTTQPDDSKRVLLEIHPNTRFEDVELVFEGAEAYSDKDLRQQLKDEGLLSGINADASDALEFLENVYRADGYLDVEIELPRQELNESDRSARVVVPVAEGPQYHVGELVFSGNERLSDERLRTASNLRPDAVYNAALLQEVFLALEEEYWRVGYQDVELEFQMEKGESEPRIRINALIEENRQSVVERIQVAGVKATSEDLALSQLGIELGQPLNFEQSTRGRRALYDTGAYTLVDLNYNPIEAAAVPSPEGVKPIEATLRLREVKPYQIRYGGFFDTDNGPGGILDLRNRNTLGSARTIGARLRADREFKEARAFFSQPLLRRFPLATNVVGFVSRTKRPGEFFDEIDDRRGFSVSQEARWNNRYILNYGYRFEKLISAQDPPDPFFPEPIRLNVAPFTVSFTRETRDDILDATHGDFLSNSFEWAPTQLGGDNSLNFIRYFGQYFRYFPLSEPTEIPFQKNVQRPRWVYATGARIGLSKGLGGQSIPDAEKFFAGGGTTVRGFEDDLLGGSDFFGPVGGNAVFLLNNELRFPVRGMFGGVAFVDIGNVYNTVSDFSFSDVRKSAGVGVRVRTPFFLIRADYGFKLDRRPEEAAGQFFFSIGQAF